MCAAHITKFELLAMPIQICLLQTAISELFAQASHSRTVTRADQYGLLAAMLTDDLSEDERICVDRLLFAVYKGRIRVVDEISAVRRLY